MTKKSQKKWKGECGIWRQALGWLLEDQPPSRAWIWSVRLLPLALLCSSFIT